jgi:hypothetical protein
VAAAVAGAKQLGHLEARKAGHLHIQENGGKVGFEQPLECLRAGRGADERLAEVAEDRFQGEQVLRPVVDEQDVDGVAVDRRILCRAGHLLEPPVRVPRPADDQMG